MSITVICNVQDIRQVQQAVRDEQNLCDLRAEIMKVQEDVLRELDSAESSPSAAAADKAQAATAEIPEEGNLGSNPRSTSSGSCLSPPVSFPGTKAPQNTPAFNLLLSSSGHGSLLRSNATASGSSAYSTVPVASQTPSTQLTCSASVLVNPVVATLEICCCNMALNYSNNLFWNPYLHEPVAESDGST